MSNTTKKRVSQETFDECVRENVEDFEMSDAEALADAISQFQKQGVDLSSIDRTGGVGRQECIDAIVAFVSAVESGANIGLVGLMDELSKMCFVASVEEEKESGTVAGVPTGGREAELATRNQHMFMDKGGVNALHTVMDRFATIDEAVLIKALGLLSDLSRANEPIRDFFEPGGSERVCKILTHTGISLPSMQTEDPSNCLCLSALTLGRTAAKTENNKVGLMHAGVADLLVELLLSEQLLAPSSSSGTSRSAVWTITQAAVMNQACRLVRELCTYTDLRKDMSCAYENGRYFLKQNNLPKTLMMLASGFKENPGVATSALTAARCMVATEEAVAMMSLHGALDLPKAVLQWPESSLSLAKSSIALMRNLCADDNRKCKLASDGTMNQLVRVMSDEKFCSDGNLMEHAFGCLAAITLRMPQNAQRLADTGVAIDMIVKSMRRHVDHQPLQRQCCLTVRNIAARSVEIRSQLLDAGVEEPLRAAGRLQAVVDEAYAALRDLNCEVNYVKVNEEGQIEPMYEQFGNTKTKMNFKASYDEYSGIEQRVQEEARAPFAREDDPDEPMPSRVPFGNSASSISSAPTPPPAPAHDHDHSHSAEGGCC